MEKITGHPNYFILKRFIISNKEMTAYATRVLNILINQFPNTPLAARATTLLDVLSRRAQIEEELRNLVVTRNTG